MPRGRRQTRVTKEEVRAVRKNMKLSSYQRKRKIKPGPWTGKTVKFKVKPRFRANNSNYFQDRQFYGKYTYTHNWKEKGWYPIIFNLEFDNMQKLVAKHGIDAVMIATETAFNEMKDKNSKPMYGNIILRSWSCDHSQDEDPEKRFISIEAKTNKKNIEGFIAIRGKEMLILGEQSEEDSEDTENDSEDSAGDL